ncbi:MAG: hypothetical protein ACRDOZ_02945 [Nocardioides sp.]
MTRVVLVPGTLALLPEYVSIEDPVADLRAACLEAVGWLGADVTVLADAQGARVAAHLLAATTRTGDAPSYLVVGNGSACRTEKAPGHFDERAAAFDAGLGRCLRDGRSESLAAMDRELASELWASVDAIVEMARVPDVSLVQVDYDDDPYGVQYWVVRWASRIP